MFLFQRFAQALQRSNDTTEGEVRGRGLADPEAQPASVADDLIAGHVSDAGRGLYFGPRFFIGPTSATPAKQDAEGWQDVPEKQPKSSQLQGAYSSIRSAFHVPPESLCIEHHAESAEYVLRFAVDASIPYKLRLQWAARETSKPDAPQFTFERKAFAVASKEAAEEILETMATAPPESVILVTEDYAEHKEFAIPVTKDVLDQACWAHADNAGESGKIKQNDDDASQDGDVTIDMEEIPKAPWTSLTLVLEPLPQDTAEPKAASMALFAMVTSKAVSATDSQQELVEWLIAAQATKIKLNKQTFTLQEIYGNTSTHLLELATRDAVSRRQSFATLKSVQGPRDCVVCMSEPCTVFPLPCRHLCLCPECAKILSKSGAQCPVCRQTFHSLIQIDMSTYSTKRRDTASSLQDIPLGEKATTDSAALSEGTGTRFPPTHAH